MKHFKTPFQEVDFPPPPSLEGELKFYVFDECSEIIVAENPLDSRIDLGYFYCLSHRKWYHLDGSTGNIRSHLHHKHRDSNDIELSPLERQHAAYMYIMSNALPFSTVEDSEFSQLMACRVDRHTFSDHVRQIADLVMNQITVQGNSIQFAVGVFDEWSDMAVRPFLGITIHCVMKATDHHLFAKVLSIGHVPLTSVHNNAPILADAIQTHFRDLNLPLPSKFVTDNAAICRAVCANLHVDNRPCFAHSINLILKDIYAQLKLDLSYVFDFAGSYGRSKCFVNFLQERESPLRALPTFTETRFYSLGKTLHHFVRLCGLIDEYCSIENLPRPTKEIFQKADQAWGLVASFGNAISVLESNKYGTNSMILPSVSLMREAVVKLDIYTELRETFVQSLNTHIQPFLENETLYLEWATATMLNPSIPVAEILSPATILAVKTRLMGICTEEGIHASDVNREPSGEFVSQTHPLNFHHLGNHDFEEDSLHPLEMYWRIADSTIKQCQTNLSDFWFNSHIPAIQRIQRVAIPFLLPPATNTSSERLFSKAKKVQALFRSSLSVEKLSNCVLLAANTAETYSATRKFLSELSKFEQTQ